MSATLLRGTLAIVAPNWRGGQKNSPDSQVQSVQGWLRSDNRFASSALQPKSGPRWNGLQEKNWTRVEWIAGGGLIWVCLCKL